MQGWEGRGVPVQGWGWGGRREVQTQGWDTVPEPCLQTPTWAVAPAVAPLRGTRPAVVLTFVTFITAQPFCS